MVQPSIPETRQIGFETLKDVTGYIRTDDGNVLHIRVHINRVGKAKDPNLKDPDGFPLHAVQNNVVITVMSEADYENMVRSKKGHIDK